ncbi:interferon-induced protein 44-like [Etheostoma cragini]|uniref:interferon-induced protein 44-like n=1 Tax=Etheostoma cragini TaxID=417921 RepID=UPI00155F161E|nr:interferon-induced protein 44-like [Etheostoma cragini]
MGWGNSKPATPPPVWVPPSPTLKEPWRNVAWGKKAKDLQYVKDYEPDHEDIKQIRILLYGPVGAGKSSFINSVTSVVRERLSIAALASATTSDKSFTKKVRTL